jgi:hypothetical protein
MASARKAQIHKQPRYRWFFVLRRNGCRANTEMKQTNCNITYITTLIPDIVENTRNTRITKQSIQKSNGATGQWGFISIQDLISTYQTYKHLFHTIKYLQPQLRPGFSASKFSDISSSTKAYISARSRSLFSFKHCSILINKKLKTYYLPIYYIYT